MNTTDIIKIKGQATIKQHALRAGKRAYRKTSTERAELKRQIEEERQMTNVRQNKKLTPITIISPLLRGGRFSLLSPLLSSPPIPLRYNTWEASGPAALVPEGPLSQTPSMPEFNMAFNRPC
jgi:hypothetical protein